MTGINIVLKRASEILDESKDNKTKMEALKLQMELYKSIMSLATDGGIVERAMKMVKVLEPLPGEEIPSESSGSNKPNITKEDKENIIEESEEKDVPTEAEQEEEPPKEEE